MNAPRRLSPFPGILVFLLLLGFATTASSQWIDPVRHNVTSGLAHAARTIPWDADHDGDTDLLLAYTFADAVYLALSAGDGGETWQTVLVGETVVAPYALPADVDCDGDRDVVALGFIDRELGFESAGKVTWYERPASLATSPWAETIIDATPIHPYTLDVGDADRDGDVDLLVTTLSFSVPNRVLLYENRCGETAGPRWARFAIATAPEFGSAGSARFADIDRDGWPDVAVADAAGSRVAWFASEGNPRRDAWTRRDVVADPANWATPNSARPVDMDGDGDLDLLVAFLDGSAVAWFECPADPLSGSWTAHPVAIGFPFAKEVVAADFDNDGRIDVAAISQQADRGGTDSMAIFQNDGAGGWVRRLEEGNYFGASTVDTGDVDGDGDSDVTSSSYGGDSADWWENLHPVPTAGQPREAAPSGDLVATKLPGGAIRVTFTPACNATDHALYQAFGPIRGGVDWSESTCALGSAGTATFDPGGPAPDGLVSFVVVGQSAVRVGSYGRDSSGVERRDAMHVGSCDRPLQIAGSCP